MNWNDLGLILLGWGMAMINLIIVAIVAWFKTK